MPPSAVLPSQCQIGTLRAELQKMLEEASDDSSGCENETITTEFKDHCIIEADHRKGHREKLDQKLRPRSKRGGERLDSLSSRTNVNTESASKQYVAPLLSHMLCF